jgi:uncharacterized protein (TIGR02118 family)
VFRITAVYPHTHGSRFDADYYCGRHAAFAREMLTPAGLRDLRITIGTAALDGGPPPFWSVSELVFEDRAAFDAAMAQHGAALFADLPNYTDVAPLMQVSDLRDSVPASTKD